MTQESTIEQVNNTTEQMEDIDINDFIPFPGAENIVTKDDDTPPSFFQKDTAPDLGFLDTSESSTETTEENTDTTVDEVLPLGDDNLEDKSGSRIKKTNKGDLNDVLSKFIEEGVLVGFDDEKPIAEYSTKDWKELLQANFEEREKAIREQTPKEFFESLPNELQYAAEYVAKGGTDLKGLFKVLAQNEEVRELNPSEPTHQELIARQYLQASGFGNGDQDLIEDQLQEWVEAGIIGKKALQFKPKLDEMQEQVIQSKLVQQEEDMAKQRLAKEKYLDNIYNTINTGELNGVKLDSKRQKFLWDELTSIKYTSLTGKPTNLLGKKLEDYQFGETPRYDLIAEALWLLSDPEDYKENIKRQTKNEVIIDETRKLKTEQSRKLSSTIVEEKETTSPARKIQRASTNIFKRNN